METFYDGYVVNAIIDACYKSAKSKKWEPVDLKEWRGEEGVAKIKGLMEQRNGLDIIKRERMPDGQVKLILRDPKTGDVTQEYVSE